VHGDHENRRSLVERTRKALKNSAPRFQERRAAALSRWRDAGRRAGKGATTPRRIAAPTAARTPKPLSPTREREEKRRRGCETERAVSQKVSRSGQRRRGKEHTHRSQRDDRRRKRVGRGTGVRSAKSAQGGAFARRSTSACRTADDEPVFSPRVAPAVVRRSRTTWSP